MIKMKCKNITEVKIFQPQTFELTVESYSDLKQLRDTLAHVSHSTELYETLNNAKSKIDHQ